MSAIIGTAAGLYLAILAALFIFQRNLLYVPNKEAPNLAEAGLDGVMQAVRTTTADGLQLLAWCRPPGSNPGSMLVYFHGNAGHIGHRADRVRPFIDAGYGVLLVEYRGFGGNPGQPSEQGLYADARAAIEFLGRQGVAPERMIFYGESLGTAVAVEMATTQGCAALVLEAPFTSVAAVAQSRYWMFPVRQLVVDKFDSLSKIAGLHCPLFLMHGERDGIIPIRYGRELFAAAPEPKEAKWFADGSHINFDDLGGPAAVIDFLRRRRATP